MTGPLAKADALLAARLVPWLDLSARKAPAGAAEEAQPVLRSPRVDNDVLQPARAGLHPQAAAVLRAALPDASATAGAGGTALSAAARAILALRSDLEEGQAGPVRGTVALWPAGRQAPAPGALASALSGQVSESGLFYESHLAEFASGARSLAQLQREPQAGLAAVAQAPAGVLPMAAAPASATAMPAASAAALVALGQAMPWASEAKQASAMQVAGMQRTELQPALRHDVPAALVEHALLRFAQAAPQPDAAEPAAPPAQASAAEAPAPAAVIHPQAATLVHQQLDVLATSMFRWAGEAWPGVPMEWSVQEEGARQQASEPADGQPRWSTTLSLELPRLGCVKVSLRLDGPSVHAQVIAGHPRAQDQLRNHGQDLSRRMSGAGLCLQNLHLGVGVDAP